MHHTPVTHAYHIIRERGTIKYKVLSVPGLRLSSEILVEDSVLFKFSLSNSFQMRATFEIFDIENAQYIYPSTSYHEDQFSNLDSWSLYSQRRRGHLCTQST